MPGLMILSATLPADRLLLLGHEDHAHAAFADLLQELVGADHRSRRDGEAVITSAIDVPLLDGAKGRADKFKSLWLFIQGTPALLMSFQQGFDLARKDGSSAHASSRNAARSSSSSISRAVRKTDISPCLVIMCNFNYKPFMHQVPDGSRRGRKSNDDWRCAGEMSSICAASSMLTPVKNRSSTSFATSG